MRRTTRRSPSQTATKSTPSFPQHYRFQVPDGCHWRDVRAVPTNVGQGLQKALRGVERANPDTLYGIFGDAQWTNKERLSDALLRDLVEHFSLVFHQVCFGAKRARWDAVVVDSRTSAFTNKTQIQEWIEDYGEDSDFVRVRVRGLPPAASDLQFIDQQVVFSVQQRTSEPLVDDPLVCGLDVARGGNDTNVFRFRRGPDARSIAPIRIPSEQTRDSMLLVGSERKRP